MHDDAYARDDDARDAIMDEAYRMGRDHGRDAASWYFDGNTSIDTYATTLAGIRDGDPAVYDTFPASPLSGEWAGDPTPATVLAALGLSDDDDDADDALAMYEDGFGVAVANVIESACIAALDPGAAAHGVPSHAAALRRAYAAPCSWCGCAHEHDAACKGQD